MFWWTERTDINTNLRLFVQNMLYVCLQFQEKKTPFLSIVTNLVISSMVIISYKSCPPCVKKRRLSALKMWTCWDRCGFRATTRSDGSEKNVGISVKSSSHHPIIPSSHHLIPSSPVPSSHHLWSHHPIIRNMFQNHHPIWHWALLIGGVTGCPWFGSWRRRVWKPNLWRIRGDVDNPPWI